MAKAKAMSRASKPSKSATSRSRVGKSMRGKSASKSVTKSDAKAKPVEDWRAETLARMRALILEADPEMIEELKWRKPANALAGIPVWSHSGIVCTGETYKQVVKLTFAKGASLPDPRALFNSSLEGNTRRAIDIREGEVLDAKAFKALIQAAVAMNLRSGGTKPTPPKPTSASKSIAKANRGAGASKPAKLLSGGNPQIAKADGDAPVQAYIAAMPGWKRELGERLDAIIVRSAPQVRKAVKWNSPFYGMEGQGWFLSFHVFTRYVKVTFFSGTSLRPVPPGGTPKSKDARWIDIHEDDEFDEAQLAKWVKQAAAIPGWMS